MVFALFFVDLSFVSSNESCLSQTNSSHHIKNRLYEQYTDFIDEFSLYNIPCYTSRSMTRHSDHHHHRTNHPDTECDIPQYGGPVGSDVTLYARATCPWTYVVDYDAERVPKRIAKAVCSCLHCQRARGVCEPVKSYIPVVKKLCESGSWRFHKSIVEVPVGCVCIRGIRARTLTPVRTVMSE